MKCIYCNSETDLTVSDIIPYALTGAKLKKEFVCEFHNGFTNKNYEKIMINNLSMYRNLLGLTNRKGRTVSFIADLEIDGYKIENESISDKASIMSGKRMFSTKDENGRKIVLGDKTKLLKIKGATEQRIKDINLANVSISRTDDIRELFISNEVLHTVAKIAYEWHCYKHNIDKYDEEHYSEIVNYILSPNADNSLVEFVVDKGMWDIYDQFSLTGSNTLFEYTEGNNTYVIFGLWNVVLYKVRVCQTYYKSVTTDVLKTLYLFHTDGSKNKAFLFSRKPIHIVSVQPLIGITHLGDDVKLRLSKIGERDLSRAYLKNNVEKIKKVLDRYKSGNLSISELLDYETNDRVTTIYILELLWENQAKYSANLTFTENMVRIL